MGWGNGAKSNDGTVRGRSGQGQPPIGEQNRVRFAEFLPLSPTAPLRCGGTDHRWRLSSGALPGPKGPPFPKLLPVFPDLQVTGLCGSHELLLQANRTFSTGLGRMRPSHSAMQRQNTVCAGWFMRQPDHQTRFCPSFSHTDILLSRHAVEETD